MCFVFCSIDFQQEFAIEKVGLVCMGKHVIMPMCHKITMPVPPCIPMPDKSRENSTETKVIITLLTKRTKKRGL